MKPNAVIKSRFWNGALCFAIAFCFYILPCSGQPFVLVNSGIAPAFSGGTAAFDFDDDGKIDIATDGIRGDESIPFSTVWRNSGNNRFSDFADFDVGFVGADLGTLAVGDVFNSGRIDIIETGYGRDMYGNPAQVSRLWHNIDGTNLVLIQNAGLQANERAYVALGDFNNDGLVDVMEYTAGDVQPNLNLGNGIFTNFYSGVSGTSVLGIFAADFDGDGYTDLLIGNQMWLNLGNGVFTNINSGLPASAVAIGDFDNDGYLDVIVANGSYQIWRNLGNATFTNTDATLPSIPSPVGALHQASAVVGDFDNGGYPDIILQTGDYNSPQLQVFYNLGNGSFTSIQTVAGTSQGTLICGDFDGDGRLDFFMTGEQGIQSNGNYFDFVAQLYHNASASPSNTPPTAPPNLSSQVMGNGVKLTWGAATDDHTPSSGLNYNIRVSSTSGGLDIVSPEADPVTGRRLVVQIGNAYERLFSLLTNLTGGTYYWSVQAIDTAFAGGAFAPESTFVIPPSISSFAFQTNGQFQINFNALATNSYTLQASTNMLQWTNLSTVIPTTNGPAQLTDTNTQSLPRRFYRLSSP